jgi:hypothetical protein
VFRSFDQKLGLSPILDLCSKDIVAYILLIFESKNIIYIYLTPLENQPPVLRFASRGVFSYLYACFQASNRFTAALFLCRLVGPGKIRGMFTKTPMTFGAKDLEAVTSLSACHWS